MVDIQDNTNLMALLGGMGMGGGGGMNEQMLPMPAVQSMPLPQPPAVQQPGMQGANPLAALLGGMGGQQGNEQMMRMMLFRQLNQPGRGPISAIANPIMAALQARALAPQYAQQQAVEQLKDRLQALQILQQMKTGASTEELNKARAVTEGGKAEAAQRKSQWFNSLSPEAQDRIFATEAKQVADANAQARADMAAATSNAADERARLNRAAADARAANRITLEENKFGYNKKRDTVKDRQWLDTYNLRGWEGEQRVLHQQTMQDLAGKKFDYNVALNRVKGEAAERRAGETAAHRKAMEDNAEDRLNEMIRQRVSTEQNIHLDNLNQALSKIESPSAREKAMIDIYLPAFEEASGVTFDRKQPGMIKRFLYWINNQTAPVSIEGIQTPFAPPAAPGTVQAAPPPGGRERIVLPPRTHPLPMVNTAPLASPPPAGGGTPEDDLLDQYTPR